MITEQEFTNYVEAAIIEENKYLLEEKAALEIELNREKERRLDQERRIRDEQVQVEGEMQKLKEETRLKDRQISALKDMESQSKTLVEAQAAQISSKEEEKSLLARQLENTNLEKQDLQQNVTRMSVAIGFLSSVLLVSAFEFTIRILSWNWLLEH